MSDLRLPNAAALVAERHKCMMMMYKAGIYFEIRKMGIETKFPLPLSMPDIEPADLRSLQEWAAEEGWLLEHVNKKLMLSPQAIVPQVEKQ
jgi:hypothetical protein